MRVGWDQNLLANCDPAGMLNDTQQSAHRDPRDKMEPFSMWDGGVPYPMNWIL